MQLIEGLLEQILRLLVLFLAIGAATWLYYRLRYGKSSTSLGHCTLSDLQLMGEMGEPIKIPEKASLYFDSLTVIPEQGTVVWPRDLTCGYLVVQAGSHLIVEGALYCKCPLVDRFQESKRNLVPEAMPPITFEVYAAMTALPNVPKLAPPPNGELTVDEWVPY